MGAGHHLFLAKLVPCDRSRIPLGGAPSLILKDTSKNSISQVKRNKCGLRTRDTAANPGGRTYSETDRPEPGYQSGQGRPGSETTETEQ